jgi:hypothetical protein
MKTHSVGSIGTPSGRENPDPPLARELLREGLAQREAAERCKQLVADYAAGRGDARALLRDLEAGQFELMDDEDA